MFIFMDSNHPIPNPTKTYKNPKAPKKTSQQETPNTMVSPTPNTLGIFMESKTLPTFYILSTIPPILYYAYVISKQIKVCQNL
jgi:hypothetical protein